ncbi:MAG TPA: hypothetical protein PK022_08660, partial [Syntrophales bacterium]|nr:hypothetical protein [Syntrophales bacterium]
MAVGQHAATTQKFLKRVRLMPGTLLFANKVSYIVHVPYAILFAGIIKVAALLKEFLLSGKS